MSSVIKHRDKIEATFSFEVFTMHAVGDLGKLHLTLKTVSFLTCHYLQYVNFHMRSKNSDDVN